MHMCARVCVCVWCSQQAHFHHLQQPHQPPEIHWRKRFVVIVVALALLMRALCVQLIVQRRELLCFIGCCVDRAWH